MAESFADAKDPLNLIQVMLAKGSSPPWVPLRPNFVSIIDYDRDQRIVRTSQQRGPAQFQKSFPARQTASGYSRSLPRNYPQPNQNARWPEHDQRVCPGL